MERGAAGTTEWQRTPVYFSEEPACQSIQNKSSLHKHVPSLDIESTPVAETITRPLPLTIVAKLCPLGKGVPGWGETRRMWPAPSMCSLTLCFSSLIGQVRFLCVGRRGCSGQVQNPRFNGSQDIAQIGFSCLPNGATLFEGSSNLRLERKICLPFEVSKSLF